MDINAKIAQELSIKKSQIDSAVALLDDGNTVPFIARYRKEVTGSLDDEQLRNISERLSSLRNLEKRREEIISSIESQDAMTPELLADITEAQTLSRLEDLYLPYKKKRKTRATVAKAKGLEPLALEIIEQKQDFSPDTSAKAYIDEEKEVYNEADALQGASDIIAEMISDNAKVRGALRDFIEKTGFLHSESDSEEPGTYSMYYDWTEKISKVAPHRILAVNRGEKEGVLKVTVQIDSDTAIDKILKIIITNKNTESADFIAGSAADSFKRLIFPSLENEIRSALFDTAAGQAIKVFGLNLKPLLMQPPLKGRVTMGFDPAYRTGCKIAVVDETGKVCDVTVVYPTPPQNKTEEAKKKLTQLIDKYNVTAIAIGNGTASKESEIFVADMLKEQSHKVDYMVVSEAGASVYSASKLGSEEFPQYDASLRSAVSIARRLQDPLAELVKIDPKAIGVGQYQHDMPQKALGETLSGVVEDCVNSVGVDLNTASGSLLSYVSGIGPALAKNIVAYREENGKFISRRQLKEVPKLGNKAFLQSAGFLRVANSDEPLDNTAVHPESYSAAKKLLKIQHLDENDLGMEKISDLKQSVEKSGKKQIAEQLDIGVPTLEDIVDELIRPGRDPRDKLKTLALHSELKGIEDLKPDMVLEGTVRNVVDFGAFVDIGVHQDGLVHISRICDRYINHPSEVLRVGDIVKVKVLEVDLKRNRISLTMRDVKD